MTGTPLLDILRQRRSIRQFLDRPVETEKLDLLQEAALRSPSSRGRNPWDFIVVTDPQLLQQLATAKQHGSAFLAGAPLAMVVTADPERCDVWIEDCSIAAFSIQLAAASLGLGSCWVQIRLRPHNPVQSAEDYLGELLGLPDGRVIDCIIGIGYPGENKAGHPRAALPWEKVHHNRYGQP